MLFKENRYLCIVESKNIRMMKKFLVVLISLVMPFALFGQTYSALWKKVREAGEKDLPQTQYEVLQQIVKKATKEKAYGQLLEAELGSAQAMTSIAPDSLKPAMERLSEHAEATKDVVLKTIYQTVLYKVYCSNAYALDKLSGGREVRYKKPELTEELCRQLAQVKDKTYDPFVKEGADSKIFDHDMLIVVGAELDDYEPLYNYYQKAGNRAATCLMAAKVYQWDKGDAGKLDSLMEVYGDLPEAGELALTRYRTTKGDMTAEEKVSYIDNALDRWGSWKRMNSLRNEKNRLINPQYRVGYELQVNQPMQDMVIKLDDLRHISSLQLKVYKVDANGDIDIRPNYAEGYKKIKPLLSETPVKVERVYTGKQPYDIFKDSLTLEGLPVGVYMLEFSTNPSTEVICQLYFVTDVYTVAESLPDKTTRYVVVSATTGQPIANAHLRIEEYVSYNKYDISNVRTDAQGEYLYKSKHNGRCEVFAYTDSDKACPEMNVANRYRYYVDNYDPERTDVFTDRAIYRPGQTVHAAAMVYTVTDGYKHAVLQGKRMTFYLLDANRKEVKQLTATTDEYGVAAVDFTLPTTGLTGGYSIRVNNKYEYIRVEEYKRPTFRVEFDDVKQHYEAGDTVEVRGRALTYAGVPVQGAEVEYTVERCTAFWWYHSLRYYDMDVLGIDRNNEEVFKGEAVTEADGSFVVKMPLIIPESEYPLFFNFVVDADVTDSAGESQLGVFSLPLGNRKTTLSLDLEDEVLLESKPTMTFHLRNAAGKDIDANVKYKIDGFHMWCDWPTQKKIELSEMRLKSGKHTVEAICEGDTLKQDFVLFSVEDTKPAAETDDWLWVSRYVFYKDGTPVTVQVGSSDKDVHIVYSIVANDKILETGAVDKTNELINRKFTYKEEYGDGVTLHYAWVKNGKCYNHQVIIHRPMPDKQLKLEWSTFRDRLTPGQEEEWTLTAKHLDGTPADAMLTATLYDQSLDLLGKHNWRFYLFKSFKLSYPEWTFPTRNGVSIMGAYRWSPMDERSIVLSRFDHEVYPSWRNILYVGINSTRRVGGVKMARVESSAMGAGLPIVEDLAVLDEDAAEKVVSYQSASAKDAVTGMDTGVEEALQGRIAGLDLVHPDQEAAQPPLQIRENLDETAFFYPQLTTDAEGRIALKFTLPESLTTWRFMGLAHTKDMYYGTIEGSAVAQKEVMIQPNMPRFIREGDEATITARIFNISERDISGKATLRLINPENDAVVYERTEPFALATGATTTASFPLSISQSYVAPLICQVMAVGDGFSDGEQHYLPLLPATEHVIVTVPFTQIEPGTKTIDLSQLIPADGTNGKLTMEYTNNPAWLMIQTLPYLGSPIDDDVISQATSYYANSIGQYLIDQNPKAKTAFELWKQETGDETSLMSALEKNQELKELILSETPWVMDADGEAEQKQRLADFFDANTMQMRLSSALDKMRNLQRGDGGWSWWPDMPGSFYMTVAVSEMLVRLNALTGTKPATSSMLDRSFAFMGNEIVEMVKEMKKQQKKGYKPGFPSLKALQWLYLCTLDGRTLPSDVQAANAYLMPLLKKEIKNQSIYEKALTAIILSKTDPKRSAEYVKSLKEYTVYREEMGRYYDTPRAGYSWCDYKIPTQTMAIEALQRLSPDDQQTIREMQRWLLQSKHTQIWDTPISSVNAVYAFLNGTPLLLDADNATITVDAKPLEMPKATAAIGYVKAPVPVESKTLTVEKTSEGTSWGAVYAQFTQPTKSVADQSAGLKVTREIISDPQPSNTYKVGDRVTVRIIIEADRDYDFVQVIDKRAACLEPVNQLSGYYRGSYCTPRDYSTNFYFDMMSKGKHVIEREYYIDRPGVYETGTCTVQCAYAPEFHGTTHSQTLTVKP